MQVIQRLIDLEALQPTGDMSSVGHHATPSKCQHLKWKCVLAWLLKRKCVFCGYSVVSILQ